VLDPCLMSLLSLARFKVAVWSTAKDRFPMAEVKVWSAFACAEAEEVEEAKMRCG